MHFDDRLDTVLKQPIRGQEIARVQYVQLLDLLGKSGADTASDRLDQAYARLSALAGEVNAAERARLLKGSGLKLRNPALVAFLCEDEPAVASAAIAAADLDEREWLDLVPALPLHSRGLLRLRRDLGPMVEMRLERLGVSDRGLPPAEHQEIEAEGAAPSDEVSAQPKAAPARGPAHESSISELVRRIERYRKSHPAPEPGPGTDAPRLPLGDHDFVPAQPMQRFDFITDAAGRIQRADAETAPMVVGMSIGTLAFRRIAGAALPPAEALRLRQPIEAQVVTLEGAPAVAGDWRIDAAPMFDAATGRYTGHAGRARRLALEPGRPGAPSALADRMRQVLHELRNPAGAIQMASEFVQQQVAGPVSHEYRAIAASIASDSASVLGGLDELDRLVKFDAGAAAVEEGEADLAVCIASTTALLEKHMAQRESGFAFEMPDVAIPVTIARNDLERMVWRLLAAIAGAIGPVEQLPLVLSAQADKARLSVTLPASLRVLDDEELFAAQAKAHGPALSAGMFGLGFTLRLAAAEAKSAGGSLTREEDALVLVLPIASSPSANVRSS